MSEREVFQELVRIAEDVVGGGVSYKNATMDSKFHEDLGLDSIAMIYTVLALEKRFEVRFDNKSLASFSTVGDIVAFIVRNTKL